jgi:cupin 2 domain-containing protein
VNPPKRNLFSNLPELEDGEDFEVLLRRGDLVIERILSSDSPDPTLYDQDQDEWVLLLEGRAILEVAGEAIDLLPGDHLLIPAHTPHRVVATHPEPRCIWLAVHLFPDASVPAGR